MRRNPLSRGSILAALLAGCTGGPADDVSRNGALQVFALAEPTLEIGVVEGDEAYTFASIQDVRRLEDGSLAVSDDGTGMISLYDPAGQFLRSWGGRGEGPGEFRRLSRLYPVGADSLMAADNATATVSVFGLDGRYARQVDATTLSGDTVFTLDSWLYGRFWVEGALDPAERARARSTLDRLPSPRSTPGYRVVRVAREGALWIREPRGGNATDTWVRTNEAGEPEAIVETPLAFRPTDIAEDRLLGVWTGAADVNFVRDYRLTETGRTRTLPSWLSGAPPQRTVPAPDEEELLATIRASIKNVAMAQEIHYSTAYSYTADVDSLEFDRPEGLEISLAQASPRGWSAVFTHPGLDRICGLGYGFDMPAGWTPGAIRCGPAATPPSSGS